MGLKKSICSGGGSSFGAKKSSKKCEQKLKIVGKGLKGSIVSSSDAFEEDLTSDEEIEVQENADIEFMGP